MKRVGLLRASAAALGGMAVVTALVAIAVVASARAGGLSSPTHASFWAVPLVAGAVVSMLSWFLLSSSPAADTVSRQRRATVSCPSCGSALLDDWRLCPHCGSSSDDCAQSHEQAAPTT